MIEYVLNSALLGLFGYLVLKALNPASARIRLFVCLATTILIAVPWYWIGDWLTVPWGTFTNLQQPAQYIGPTFQDFDVVTASPLQNTTSALTWLLPTFIIAGLFAFLLISLVQYRKVCSWRTIARAEKTLAQQVGNNIEVWIVPGGKQAQATFFGRREIWLGQDLINHPNLNVALLHESTHHQLNHPLITWLLTFLRCAYWWHPIVWFYVATARRELELECDEHCANSLGIRAYQRDLAELLIDVKYDTLGSAFGGRKNFDIARIKKLSEQRVLSALRKTAAGVLFLASATGFVLVHAQTEPQIEKKHQGWNVRMENVSAVKAFEHIATLGGLDIYLDPSLDLQRVDYEADKVTDWPILMDGLTTHLGVHWVERAGAIFVGSVASVNDTGWLPNAVLLRGQGVGVFAQQNRNEANDEAAIRIDLILREIVSANDFSTSEMAILIKPNNPAAIRQGKTHISFKALTNDGDDKLSVGLFKIKEDGAMQKLGSETMALHYGISKVFEWKGVDGLTYELSIKPTLRSR